MVKRILFLMLVVTNPAHQAQALDVVKTEWKPAYHFTRKSKSSVSLRRIGPQQFNFSAPGNYTLQISPDGSVYLEQDPQKPGIKVQVKSGGSRTHHACAKYRSHITTRYIRYEQWATYSNGSVKKTGGTSDVRQPSRFGDAIDQRISGWTLC